MLCPHCHREIPESAFVLHEVHCKRFLYHCKDCDELIPKTQKEEHISEFHSKENCSYCGKSINKLKLEIHMKNCEAKPKECMFCGAVMDLLELIRHEDFCGSRTDFCEICNKNIPKKRFEEHLQICIQSLDNLELGKRQSENHIDTCKKKPKLEYN
ncbi:XAF1_4 [Blepharisma stoltei]|uniref:TRAFD1/XAF1 zinc finger domain-containing protein n=1 Tax=Blepharisma stoltei TaxID=1481888 RepID=A0AAU9JL51_9CILI|nr:unnamed protein product [Blepharisma stoltei]